MSATLNSVAKTITLTTSESTTPAVNMRGALSATVYAASGTSMASLTLYSSPTFTETTADVYLPVIEQILDPTATSYGVEAIVMTVAAGQAMKIPAAAFPCAGMRFKGSHAGAITIHIHYAN